MHNCQCEHKDIKLCPDCFVVYCVDCDKLWFDYVPGCNCDCDCC
jgi:hypothetical protein